MKPTNDERIARSEELFGEALREHGIVLNDTLLRDAYLKCFQQGYLRGVEDGIREGGELARTVLQEALEECR